MQARGDLRCVYRRHGCACSQGIKNGLRASLLEDDGEYGRSIEDVRDPMAVVTAYDAAPRPKIALPRDLYGAEREDTAGLALGAAFPAWEATPACVAFTGSTATAKTMQRMLAAKDGPSCR